MPIVAADINFKRSINTGPGNSTAQTDPNDSIGGFQSSTAIPDATLHALFDAVSGAENAASDVEYRGLFIENAHGTLTLQAATIWLTAEVAGGAVAAIAADGVGVTANNSASAQMERIADEGTTPAGETFTAPTTKGTGIVLGNIAALSTHGVWMRRTAANTVAVSNDGVTLNVEGDTAA